VANPPPSRYLVAFVGTTGVSMSIACLWFGVRMLMEVGVCASGGPYEIQQQCPEGASLLLAASIPVGLVFGVIMMWGMNGVSENAALLTLLSWPALYLTLAWNFVEGGGLLGIFCALLCLALCLPALYLIKAVRSITDRRPAVYSILFGGTIAGIFCARAFVDLIN